MAKRGLMYQELPPYRGNPGFKWKPPTISHRKVLHLASVRGFLIWKALFGLRYLASLERKVNESPTDEVKTQLVTQL